MTRAQQGDVDAFAELVRLHTRAVYGRAFAILKNRDDAADATQDAFFAAWRNLNRFRGDSALWSWLHTIVSRLAFTRLKRRRAVISLDTDATVAAPGPGPDQLTETAVLTGSVRSAINGLPAAQATAVQLHHLQGLSYAEVAGQTDTTLPAVRSHLFRARRSLAPWAQQWR